MNCDRRRFLRAPALAVLCVASLLLTACPGKDEDEIVYPTSAPGTAQAPARPDSFGLRNDLGAVVDPGLALGTPGPLISIGHLTDVHITIEDFSLLGYPALEALLDSFGDALGFGGLDRPQPQERFDVDVLQAVIKTMNAVSNPAPLDLIINTGDALDVGTEEELLSFLTEINQSELPWLQTIGNHDILALGNIPADLAQELLDRHWSELRWFIEEHFNQAHLPTLTKFGTEAMGFDFDPAFNGNPRSASGFFGLTLMAPTRDALGDLLEPGIRLYVLKTTMDEGAATGRADEEQVDWLDNELDGVTDSLVLIACHHPLTDLVEGWDELQAVLFEHPQVIAVLCGHDHWHRIRPVENPAGGGFWQIETSSLIDFPQQARILEIVNNGDGTGLIRTFVFNQQAEGQLGENARASYDAAVEDGWEGEGSEDDRDVELVFQFPPMG
ncbi:MAG: metallophosphoesterase [Planctomycetota bacterium]